MELGIKAKLGKAFTTIPTTFRLKSVNGPPVLDCVKEHRFRLKKLIYLESNKSENRNKKTTMNR
jgi:hypothetical protein